MKILLWRILKSYMGHPAYSIAMALLYFSMCLIMIFLGSYSNMIEIYISELSMYFPVSALFVSETGEDSQIDICPVYDIINNDDNVLSYNVSGSIQISWKGIPVTIYGYLHPDYCLDFIIGENYLVQGKFPGCNKSGVIISEDLAQMGFHVEDIENSLFRGEQMGIDILCLGTFRGREATIYTDIDSFTQMGGALDILHPTIYLSNPYRTEELISKINSSLPPDLGYRFVDSTDYPIRFMFDSLESWKSIQLSYLSFVLLCVFLINVFFRLHLRMKQTQEHFILRVLGETNKKIMKQVFFQDFIMFFLSLILSSFITVNFSPILCKNILAYLLSSSDLGGFGSKASSIMSSFIGMDLSVYIGGIVLLLLLLFGLQELLILLLTYKERKPNQKTK